MLGASLPMAPPAPATPAADPSAAPPQILTPDQVAAWRSRTKAALEHTKDAINEGKTNVQRYLGKPLGQSPLRDTAAVPTDFYFIEAKRSQLFHRTPDVYVTPEMPGLEDAAVVFQAALNKELGPRGVHVLPTVKQVLFDVLCPTGFGALVLGFQTAVDPAQPEIPVQVGEEPDPEAPAPPLPAGSVLGLSAQPPMRPVFQSAPNLVAKWYFVEHLSPGDLLVDPLFVGLDFDKAAWVGQRFREDLPEGETASGRSRSDDDRRLMPLSSGAQDAQRQQRTGYELWYRAHLFDPDVQHPDKIRMFRLYDDDRDAAVVVRDHPHQRYKTAAGELAAGMRGYPICPVTLRYVSDTWLAPSDCSMARNTADELSKGRTQMLQARDRNMPQVGYDATRVHKDTLAKIERNDIGGLIGFDGAYSDATWPIQKGAPLRETFQFDEVAQRDLALIWRMGPNQVGTLDSKNRTATEQQITAQAAQGASEADRAVILSWYVDKVVAKFAALLQLYADQTQFVELVGTDAQRLVQIPPQIQQQAQQTGQDARTLVPWNKDLIQGVFSFSAKPNSQIYIDAAQERQQLLDLWKFFAQEPTVNRSELTRAILAHYGFDPSKIMQQPPPKGPEPPKVALTFTGPDMSSPVVLDILSKLGVAVDPQAIQVQQQMLDGGMLVSGGAKPIGQTPAPPPAPVGSGMTPQHGGMPPQMAPIDKHSVDQTHAMQGTGVHAPLGPGGIR